ncbi:MAG: hypothetical protein A3K77_02640 [Euryarchaeota archaeon RBG_13_31_8]|nr:MAG: hypothetical protein A3K77_02640 [Euryarchaeota archaeon RBG_13_31_8]
MSYNVYVIELDKEVLKSRKFRTYNPQLKPEKTCFYVGQSCHSPDVRFRQHKDGYKANRFAKKYGLCLRVDIYEIFNPIKTRDAAERIEQGITEKLRELGHGVWSN